jgi:hypothetical protein
MIPPGSNPRIWSPRQYSEPILGSTMTVFSGSIAGHEAPNLLTQIVRP